jgi:uncharacterized RDD family membrane protein YckC
LPFCARCGAQVPAGAAFCPSCGSPVGTAGAQRQVSISGISTVSRDAQAQQHWIKRLLAYVIDAIVVYAVIGLAVAAAAIPAFIRGVFVPGNSPGIFPFGAYFGTFAGLLFVLYFTFAEATYGRTVGKAAMGLRVTTESGGRPSLGASFLRNLSKINWVLLLLDVILGLALEAGYTKKFSDRFLRTSVIQVQARPGPFWTAERAF